MFEPMSSSLRHGKLNWWLPLMLPFTLRFLVGQTLRPVPADIQAAKAVAKMKIGQQVEGLLQDMAALPALAATTPVLVLLAGETPTEMATLVPGLAPGEVRVVPAVQGGDRVRLHAGTPVA